MLQNFKKWFKHLEETSHSFNLGSIFLFLILKFFHRTQGHEQMQTAKEAGRGGARRSKEI